MLNCNGLNNMIDKTMPSEERSILMRKLLAICPLCKKTIFGRDVDFSQIQNENCAHYPIRYDHAHEQKGFPKHSLTLYIDANFAVRGQEIKK